MRVPLALTPLGVAFALLFSAEYIVACEAARRSSSRDGSFIGYSETFIIMDPLPPPPPNKAKDEEFLIFTTAYGDITVRLFVHQAPKAVQYIKFLVEKEFFDGCAFYRAEPPGETSDTGHASTRKGYALVQGGLHSCGRQRTDTLPAELNVSNKKGTVSLITGTSEFFFNLEDHLEWNESFTVWGEVADKASWKVLNTIVSLPTRQELHPSGTVLRILLNEVVFSVSLKI